MEKWEKVYLHEKAVRDALLISNDLPIPKNEKPWTLSRKEIKNLHRYYDRRFFDELENLGHDRVFFEKCKCINQ
jgi:hypothetical protein